MKKLFTLGVASLLAVTAGYAQEPTITILDGGVFYGGYMPEAISPHGTYICGSTFAMAGFVSEWQKQQTKVFLEEDGSQFDDYGCDLPFVTENGVALGFDNIGPLKIDINTQTIRRLYLSDRAQGVTDGLPAQMTEDGNIIVGLAYHRTESQFLDPHNIDYQAAYWENGECHLLPIPTEEELGYYYLGTRARCISADGSVIMGEIVDRLYTNPMVLWFRQPDGSYELDPICMEYFSDIKYNDGSYKEFVEFSGKAMSSNGKWIVMLTRKAPEYNKPAYDPRLLSLFDIEKRKIVKTYIIDGENGIYPETLLEVYYNGISDNGTIVGCCTSTTGSNTSFIIYPDDNQPRLIADVFDNIGQFADFEDEGTNRVGAISADGRYLTGFGWGVDTQYDRGIYIGYVLDMGKTDDDHSSVGKVEVAPEGPDEYFDVNGRRHNAPVKGINIVRSADGSTRKVLIP